MSLEKFCSLSKGWDEKQTAQVQTKNKNKRRADMRLFFLLKKTLKKRVVN